MCEGVCVSVCVSGCVCVCVCVCVNVCVYVMTIFISSLVVDCVNVNVRGICVVSWKERSCIIALFNPFSMCDEIKYV